MQQHSVDKVAPEAVERLWKRKASPAKFGEGLPMCFAVSKIGAHQCLTV